MKKRNLRIPPRKRRNIYKPPTFGFQPLVFVGVFWPLWPLRTLWTFNNVFPVPASCWGPKICPKFGKLVWIHRWFIQIEYIYTFYAIKKISSIYSILYINTVMLVIENSHRYQWDKRLIKRTFTLQINATPCHLLLPCRLRSKMLHVSKSSCELLGEHEVSDIIWICIWTYGNSTYWCVQK